MKEPKEIKTTRKIFRITLAKVYVGLKQTAKFNLRNSSGLG